MIEETLALKVNGLTKTFIRTAEHGGTETFYALNNVSFQLKRGEILGIIGKNGSGKSTLLKILSSVTRPTEGEVILRGKVLSILDIGTGMHPDLSGRQNIFLRGELLGMTKQEIKDAYPKIVEFSEIGDFIETPVKHYSSGMFLRLAFAIIIHLKADILLLDEVLSVGDLGFREKVRRALNALPPSTTVVIVSHEIHTVREFVDSILYLKSDEHRSYVFSCKTDFPFDDFVSDLSTISHKELECYSKPDVVLLDQKLLENNGETTCQFRLNLNTGSEPIFFGIQAQNDLGNPVFMSTSPDIRQKKGAFCFEVALPHDLFGYGTYTIHCGILFKEGSKWKMVSLANEAQTLTVTNSEAGLFPKEYFNGILQPTFDWQVTPQKE